MPGQGSAGSSSGDAGRKSRRRLRSRKRAAARTGVAAPLPSRSSSRPSTSSRRSWSFVTQGAEAARDDTGDYEEEIWPRAQNAPQRCGQSAGKRACARNAGKGPRWTERPAVTSALKSTRREPRLSATSTFSGANVLTAALRPSALRSRWPPSSAGGLRKSDAFLAAAAAS